MLHKRSCYCPNFIFHVNGEERRGECNVVLSVKSTEMKRKVEPQEYHGCPASYSHVENDIKYMYDCKGNCFR